MNKRLFGWAFGAGVLGSILWSIMKKPIKVPGTFLASIPAPARDYASFILEAAQDYNLDPYLLVAIGWRESQWGMTLTPKGPTGTGDSGHGRGLMQIDDRAHSAWVAANNWADPRTNIRKGAEVLKEAFDFFASQRGTGRVVVNRAAFVDPRPLTGVQLIRAALAAYNAGPKRVLELVAQGQNPDLATTGLDYSAWVLSRADTYRAAFV